MEIIKIKDVKEQHLGAPLFTGGEVIRQSPVTDDKGSDLSIDYVHFEPGARNKLHSHENDQVLIVTHGRGIVATEGQEYEVGEDDVIYTPAGQPHYHGAGPDSDFTHISVTRAHTKITQIEE